MARPKWSARLSFGQPLSYTRRQEGAERRKLPAAPRKRTRDQNNNQDARVGLLFWPASKRASERAIAQVLNCEPDV